MKAPDRATTLGAVVAGIDAVVAAVRDGRPDAASPCTGWDALTVVRHLEGIAGAYVLWAGSSLGGRIARMRTGVEAADYNATILARLPRLGLAEHLDRFVTLACDHVRLARVTWTTPMLQTPDDVILSVGQHAGVAAVEWHVHAWDLARSQGRQHTPDADSLAVCVGAWEEVLADVAGRALDDEAAAWPALLAATGRTP